MLNLIKSALFLTLIFAQDAVRADGALPYASKTLSVRADDNNYINLVKGLFRSNGGKVLHDLFEIPCEDVHTLEEDAHKAKEFVTQLKNGQVPSILTEIPREEVQQLKDVINIALSLPDELKTAAEGAATDAVKVFNDIEDGTIINDIKNLTGVILSDVTSGWADFTTELTDAWGAISSDVGCWLIDCPEPTTARSCGAATAATTTNDGTAAMTQNTARRTTQSAPYPTGATSVARTSAAAAATTHHASQRTTQSPPRFTGTVSMASTHGNWMGLGIVMAIAVGINGYALFL